MVGLIIFVIGLIFIAVICVITFFVSKVIFDHRSNKILAQGGNPSGKRSKMAYPGIVTLVTGIVLVVLLAVVSTITMSLSAIFDNITDSNTGVISSAEEDVPSINVAYVRSGEYAPEEELYSLETTASDNDFTCSLYVRKDPFDSSNPLYIVVCSYEGDENAALIEAQYLHGKTGMGSLTHLEGMNQLIWTPIWHAEYPGTLQINLKDYDGENIIGRVAFQLDNVSAVK